MTAQAHRKKNNYLIINDEGFSRIIDNQVVTRIALSPYELPDYYYRQPYDHNTSLHSGLAGLKIHELVYFNVSCVVVRY